MKKVLNFLTSRLFIISFLLFLQVASIVLALLFLSSYFVYVYAAFSLLSVGITIWIVSKNENPMFKIAWLIPTLLFPIVGAPLYLLFGKRNISPRMKRDMRRISEVSRGVLPEDRTLCETLSQEDTVAARQVRYIQRTSDSPLFAHTYTEFLPLGEFFFERLVEELEKAENFIFMEYFMIQEGKMWNTVLDIMAKKAAQGLDVRLIYDDLGTINLLRPKYDAEIRKLGIRVQVFNPFRPSLDAFMNYRDHRKISVIDGNVGFTGGNNLSDEYINAYPKHGHWKDCSVILKGDAVSKLTVMFLEFWQLCSGEVPDYSKYLSTQRYETNGLVQPFGDGPVTGHLTGELSYIGLLNAATRYVYIMTPYLILDNEMLTALNLAADSGVDVRIITPHVGDKWFVHEVTRANYRDLLAHGVRIYEYTPGFVHGKAVVADDRLCIVGTTNFDFRSFYLHFENGIWMYDTPCVAQVKVDFLQTLEKCQEITMQEVLTTKWYRKVIRAFLRLFSPMM